MLAYTPGPMEVIVILIIALLVFGRRLPETGKSLGIGIKEFRKGLKGVMEDDDADKAEKPALPEGEPPTVEDPYRDVDGPEKI